MDAVARSAAQAVAMGAVPPPAVSGAVGFFPAAKEVLLHAGWRGVTDGAAMTLSSAIYDATVHGKALAWGGSVDARGRTVPGIRTELGANLPAFVLQHILMGGAHRLLPEKSAEAPFTRAASDSSSPAKNPFRPRPRNVIDAEILPKPVPGEPARLSAPATDETRSNGPARLPASANDTPRPPAHPLEMILDGTDPARLVGMHPAEYKQWLVEHLDLTPAGEISSAAQLDSASTAITAARGRGDKPTEQILTGQLHAARQPTDWTPEKLAAQGVEVTPEAVADLNARAEAFNQSLGEKKSWLGLPENPPAATVRVSNTVTTATPSAPVVTGGLETIPFPPDPVSSPVHAPVHPAEVFDTNGTVIPASSRRPVLPPPVGFSGNPSFPAQPASDGLDSPLPAGSVAVPAPTAGVTFPSGETVPSAPWQPSPRFQKPAADKGHFTGDIGNSPFALSDAKADAMGLPRGTMIPWINGIPDFGAHVVPGPNGSPGIYQVPGLTGDHKADRRKIIRQLAKDNGVSQKKIRQWLKQNQIEPHHSGGNNVQNVPKQIHDLQHSGGALEIREKNNHVRRTH